MTAAAIKDRIDASTLRELHSRVRLSDLVGRSIRLRKAGHEYEGICPFHQEKSPSFTVNDQKHFYHCFGCKAHGDAIDFLINAHRMSFRDAVDMLMSETGLDGLKPLAPVVRDTLLTVEEDAGRNTEAAKRIWTETRPAAGTLVETYLRSRGITIPPPPTLHYGFCRHASTGQNLPTMVAAVAKFPSRDICAIHRTYLRMDGLGKAPLSNSRMMLGPCGGGAVRLAAAAKVLAVAEGIETALSVMQQTGISTWAAMSSGGIEHLILPDMADDILICADNDRNGVGPASARRAAEKWLAEGRRVRVAMPATKGEDFNDLLRRGEAFTL